MSIEEVPGVRSCAARVASPVRCKIQAVVEVASTLVSLHHNRQASARGVGRELRVPAMTTAESLVSIAPIGLPVRSRNSIRHLGLEGVLARIRTAVACTLELRQPELSRNLLVQRMRVIAVALLGRQGTSIRLWYQRVRL